MLDDFAEIFALFSVTKSDRLIDCIVRLYHL